MNVHEHFENLVQPYLAGGLSPEERDTVDRHLVDCAPCTTALADAQEFAAFLTESLDPLRPPEGLEDRLLDGMGWPRSRPAKTPSRPLPLWTRLAAAVVLFMAVGAFATTPSLRAGLFGGRVSQRSEVASLPRDVLALEEGRVALGLSSLYSDFDTEVPTGAWIKNPGEDDLGDRMPSSARQPVAGGASGPRGGSGAPMSRETFAPTANLDGDAPVVLDGITNGAAGGAGAALGRDFRFKRSSGATDVLNLPVVADTETSLGDQAGFDRFVSGVDFGEVNPPFPRVSSPAVPPVLEEIQNPASPDPEPQDTQDRKIIRNGNLELEVESFDTAFAGITDLVAANGGFVSSSNRHKLANGKIRGTVVVRVPQEEFSAVALALGELGDLKNQSVSSQEVTKQYVDLSSRLRSKTVLEERLIRMLEEAEGELKDLLVVEKELGQVRSDIEQIQGELNYYDNLVSLSTITLNLRERDIGQPFEYVQTLESQIGVTVEDVESAYESAQDILAENGGRILDAGMTRQGADQATGTIVAAVDADAFPAVRQALRGLGDVSADTVNRRQQPRGGTGDAPSPDAPVIREEARISLQVSTPPTVITLRGEVSVVADDPGAAFASARTAAEAVGGQLLGGGMTDQVDGSRGTLQILVDAARARVLVDQLEALGEVQSSTVSEQQPSGDAGLRRERGEIRLSITSPANLVDRSQGIAAVFRDTIAGSIRGILWSLEMLVVGIAYVGPWLLGLLVLVWIYRRTRRKNAGVTPAGS